MSNVSSVAAARLHGLPLRFIAPAGVATPDTTTDVLLIPKDSAVRSTADLNGKTIASAGIRSFKQVSASAFLDQHEGDARTAKFVEIPFPETGNALGSHRIDAALTTEPFTTVDLGAGRSLGPILQSFAPNYLLLGWVATQAWLQTHQAVATKFAGAIRRASPWANLHRKESGAISIKYAKIPPDVVATISRSTYATDLTAAMIAPPIEATVKNRISTDRCRAASSSDRRAPDLPPETF